MVFLYFSLYFKKISDIIDIIGNKNEMEYYGQVKQRKKNGDKRYHDNAGSTGDEAAAGAGFFYCTSAGWRNTGNRRGNRAPMSVLFHMG